MLPYNHQLKSNARSLRVSMTDAEKLLWSRLRRKQILGVQFYRQKILGNYIVDFYAPAVKLVIEVDGSQHLEVEALVKDQQRTEFLEGKNLSVLRFDNLQVLNEVDAVIEVIFHAVEEVLSNQK